MNTTTPRFWRVIDLQQLSVASLCIEFTCNRSSIRTTTTPNVKLYKFEIYSQAGASEQHKGIKTIWWTNARAYNDFSKSKRTRECLEQVRQWRSQELSPRRIREARSFSSAAIISCGKHCPLCLHCAMLVASITVKTLLWYMYVKLQRSRCQQQVLKRHWSRRQPRRHCQVRDSKQSVNHICIPDHAIDKTPLSLEWTAIMFGILLTPALLPNGLTFEKRSNW